MLTIFTPTYNRKYTLDKLYRSLVSQTNQDFEWLIIDDGSTDGTEEYVKELISEGKIKLRYYYQKNAGKSQAHNKGVELTQTELFVCVDSDDYLREDAVQIILEAWRNKKNDSCIGILAFRAHEDGSPITIVKDQKIDSFTLKDGYDKYGLKGDTMLIYKTDKIKKYKFPYFEGEKFIPEAYLYDILDQEGKLLIVRKNIYICEYRTDGYTYGAHRLLANNPQGTLAYIEQRLKLDNTFKNKVSDTIRYVAIAKVAKKKKIISKAVYPFVAALVYPVGIFMYNRRYK